MGLLLLIGGARSGKSSLAVRLAAEQAAPVVFLATGRPVDADMGARIQRHRDERPAHWQTVEEPLDLQAGIERVPAGSCLVIDCLSVWSANALEALGAEAVEREAAAAAAAAASRRGATIAVTNEVGMGVHPVSELGRSWRDLHGRVNAIWAQVAERAFLVVAGRTLSLGAPERDIGGIGG
jgi:adenosylcobinamide kinase / adenosylcobinamide-phosphate guanylyltransferase